MIINPQISQNNKEPRSKILDFLKTKKFNTVIDFGGSVDLWAKDYVTHLVDIKRPDNFSEKNFLKCDLDYDEDWDALENLCEKNGKFDFAICSHVLEDLNAPYIFCKKISKIAKAGYIAMPFKGSEFSFFERCYPRSNPLKGYMGYHHHRWIYEIRNNILTGYPKMNCIDQWCKFPSELTGYPPYWEINFLWEDDFSYHFIKPFELLDPPDGDHKIYQLFSHDDISVKL